jgi:microcystin-dependent protein
MDPYLGEIRVFGFGFAPTGWMACDGQILPIASNTALYSLLGSVYGGDGVSTFALPDFRARAPAHQNPPDSSMGQVGGAEKAQSGFDFVTTPTLTANFCIAVQGIYPPRP